jgi:hypothetical protein
MLIIYSAERNLWLQKPAITQFTAFKQLKIKC